MSRRAVSWAALLVALPGLAAAADLPSKKGPIIPPPVFTWDGWYAGTMIGYGFSHVTETSSGVASPFNAPGLATGYLGNSVWDTQGYSSRGPQTGFHIGYLKQFGHFVGGIEGDVDFATNHTAKTVFGTLGLATGGPVQTNVQDNWRISLVGKAGYADGNSLYYVLGGLVNGGYQVRHDYWGQPTTYTSFGYATGIANNDINDIERFGWTVGAGLEYAFADHWSANLEYRHNDFGTAHTTSTGNQLSGLDIPGTSILTAALVGGATGGGIAGLHFAERSYEDSFRLGINYHFGGPAPAAAASAPPKGPTQVAAAPAAPPPPPDPSFIGRLYHAYADEWGLDSPPADPKAPPTRRAYFPPAPVTQAPYPFTEWPFGGSNGVGITYPSTVDSPLMTALAPTEPGKLLNDWHTQIYGWINPGFNVSTTRSLPGQITGGNFPAAYSYQPNVLQLDQIVLMFERLPDTVQKDHFDWGFRFSPLYGETYRYTTAGGIFSKQLQKWNLFAGYDAPMIYAELYFPWVFEGVTVRVGRYISVPDIEAQLAPNNYMYSHSMTYGYDNYTNQGVIAAWQLTKNWMVETGIEVGTDSSLWNSRQVHYPALFGGQPYSIAPGIWETVPAGYLVAGQSAYNGPVDPGIQPSFVGCVRYQSDDAYNAIYSCANGINSGAWGYNNLQETTTTLYHKFDEAWHISIETWYMRQHNAPNTVSPFYGEVPNIFLNQLNVFPAAICLTSLNPSCESREWAALTYLNWKFSPLDNISWRAEYFNDITGQRTGFKTSYFNYAMGWQHWFSPTIEIRPEVAWYNSLKTPAFENGTKSHATIFSADLLWHF